MGFEPRAITYKAHANLLGYWRVSTPNPNLNLIEERNSTLVAQLAFRSVFLLGDCFLRFEFVTAAALFLLNEAKNK